MVVGRFRGKIVAITLVLRAWLGMCRLARLRGSRGIKRLMQVQWLMESVAVMAGAMCTPTLPEACVKDALAS